MNNVNKTLYIPLYGKAFVSKKGIILHDEKAEDIWSAEGFKLKGKSKSKWLAYYMGMRSAVFDSWVKEKMNATRDAVILHIGCGMDSRALRIGETEHLWYDIDFPEVIEERKKYYAESGKYRMLGVDVRSDMWTENIIGFENAIIIMEGVSMYLETEELRLLFEKLTKRFGRVHIFMDSYTLFAAKMSKFKNPINDVGVKRVYGLDDPKILEENTGVKFIKEHDMTPDILINELHTVEKSIFKRIFAGKFSKKLYRLYEFAGSSAYGR